MTKIINVVAFIIVLIISAARAMGYITSVQSKYLLIALLVVFSVLYYKDRIISWFNKK